MKKLFDTRFWDDTNVLKMSVDARLLFIYFITNPRVGICDVFELADEMMLLQTGLTEGRLSAAKAELEERNRARFHEGWVYLTQWKKHNDYEKSEQTRKGYERQLALVPSSVLSHFLSPSETPTRPPTGSLQTPYGGSKSKSNSNRDSKSNILNICRAYLDFWNEAWGTKYSAADPLKDNLEYWLGIYTSEQIRDAVMKAKTDPFWKDKIRPATLLRRKNRANESVDYIGDLLNRRQSKSITKIT